jgi:hypothetical protein
LEVIAGLNEQQEVICGNQACRTKLADIVATRIGDRILRKHRYLRYVELGPGWHQVSEKRWALTAHAKARLEKERALASNRDDEHAKRHLAADKVIRHRRPVHFEANPADPHDLGEERSQVSSFLQLPCEVLCPRCGAINILDRASLRALSYGEEAQATPDDGDQRDE